MSSASIAWAWEQAISSDAKIVLLCMANWESGLGYPSDTTFDRLCKSSMLDEEIVDAALDEISAKCPELHFYENEGQRISYIINRQWTNEPQYITSQSKQKKYKKKKISKKKRAVVFARDNHQCKHCGAIDDLTIDHITAEVNGGSQELENLQTLCRSCNSRKGAK